MIKTPVVKLRKAQIHLTSKCNLRCKYCIIRKIPKNRKDIPDKKWLKIANNICELKPELLVISGGGEPTLRFDLLLKILNITRENNIKTQTITNGTLITKEYAKKIVEIEPYEWRTSICSPNEKTDTFLRNKNISIKSFKGINYIVEWKKKLGKELPKLDISMILTKYNISHIQKMIEKALSVEANTISLRIVETRDSWLYPKKEQIDKFIQNLEDYRNLAENLGLAMNLDFLPEEISPINKSMDIDKKFSDIACTIPFHELVIFADGRVAPCCSFLLYDETSKFVETIIKKSLINVWWGEKFDLLRKGQNIILPKVCNECIHDQKVSDSVYREKLDLI